MEKRKAQQMMLSSQILRIYSSMLRIVGCVVSNFWKKILNELLDTLMISVSLQPTANEYVILDYSYFRGQCEIDEYNRGT